MADGAYTCLSFNIVVASHSRLIGVVGGAARGSAALQVDLEHVAHPEAQTQLEQPLRYLLDLAVRRTLGELEGQ